MEANRGGCYVDEAGFKDKLPGLPDKAGAKEIPENGSIHHKWSICMPSESVFSGAARASGRQVSSAKPTTVHHES